MATPHQQQHRGGYRGEEVKEAISETYEHGKERLQATVSDTGNLLLTFALICHSLLNLIQGAVMWLHPEKIAADFIGEVKMRAAPWVFTRCFALQTLALGAISGGAALKYDVKHKYLLNMILLTFHLVAIGDMTYNHWMQNSGFKLSPGFFHVPMAALHSVALMSHSRPDVFAKAKST